MTQIVRPASLARHALTALTLAALLGACTSKGEAPDLMRFRNTTAAPNEFLVNPAKPLEVPESNALPTPTPGSANRADPRPIDDAVAALGGSPAALAREGIPGGDGALVSHASRYGTDPAIRRTLEQEDIDYRRRNNLRPVERLFGMNGYYRAYGRQSLDQQSEMDRLRARGVRVPSAPPKELAPE